MENPVIDWLPNGLIAHNLDRPRGLVECASVLDVGAGLRPMQWYRPAQHICVEPYDPYAERLVAAGFTVMRTTAEKALEGFTWNGAVYILDVIEHMEKEEGERVVKLAVETGARQVVIFTPLGFLPQDGDAWGLNGHHWQTHRSGWTPDDFKGWDIEISRCGPRTDLGRGFFATWTRTVN